MCGIKSSVEETLNCECKGRNLEDSYTVTLQKGAVIVGHVSIAFHVHAHHFKVGMLFN